MKNVIPLPSVVIPFTADIPLEVSAVYTAAIRVLVFEICSLKPLSQLK